MKNLALLWLLTSLPLQTLAQFKLTTISGNKTRTFKPGVDMVLRTGNPDDLPNSRYLEVFGKLDQVTADSIFINATFHGNFTIYGKDRKTHTHLEYPPSAPVRIGIAKLDVSVVQKNKSKFWNRFGAGLMVGSALYSLGIAPWAKLENRRLHDKIAWSLFGSGIVLAAACPTERNFYLRPHKGKKLWKFKE